MTKADRVALILALAAVISALAACKEIVNARDEINRLVAMFTPREETMQTKEAEWKDADGVTRRVTTQRLMVEGGWESLESWCKRHDKAVEAEMLAHPPAK